MTNKEAITWLREIKEKFTGNCTIDTLVPISRCDVQAIDLAIKALEERPLSDNYCCKYYESNQNDFVSSPIEVVKVGEPLPNSDEINKAMERGKLYKRGYKDALDKAFSEFDANCTYSGDRVLQILEKLKEAVQNETN